MTKYQITSSAGVDMGAFEGETEVEALDAMARDAGYANQADVIADGIAPFDGVIKPVPRTVAEAETIIEANGAASWVGLDDEDLLGCTRVEHEEWLVSAQEKDLVAWAKGVAADDPEDEPDGPSCFFTPYPGAKRNDAIYRGEEQMRRESTTTVEYPEGLLEVEHCIGRATGGK